MIEQKTTLLPTEKLPPRETFGAWVEALRPLHWTKNIFVGVALVFSHRLIEWAAVLQTAIVFVLFCGAASAVYLINDVFDRHDDARHPSKNERPITRGALSIHNALFTAVVLAGLSGVGAFYFNFTVGLFVGGYIVLNIGYTLVFKKIVILDVLIIAAGFGIRVVAGAIAIHYTLATWVLVCTFFVSSLIGFSKRRYEIIYDGASPLHTRGYTPYFLDMLVLLSAALSIGSYSFYILSRGTWQNGWSIALSLGAVFYGVLRYVYLIHLSEEKLDHTKLILSDKPLMATVFVWIGLFVIEIYYVNPSLTFP